MKLRIDREKLTNFSVRTYLENKQNSKKQFFFLPVLDTQTGKEYSLNFNSKIEFLLIDPEALEAFSLDQVFGTVNSNSIRFRQALARLFFDYKCFLVERLIEEPLSDSFRRSSFKNEFKFNPITLEDMKNFLNFLQKLRDTYKYKPPHSSFLRDLFYKRDSIPEFVLKNKIEVKAAPLWYQDQPITSLKPNDRKLILTGLLSKLQNQECTMLAFCPVSVFYKMRDRTKTETEFVSCMLEFFNYCSSNRIKCGDSYEGPWVLLERLLDEGYSLQVSFTFIDATDLLAANMKPSLLPKYSLKDILSF